jgi:hypothetical protein
VVKLAWHASIVAAVCFHTDPIINSVNLIKHHLDQTIADHNTQTQWATLDQKAVSCNGFGSSCMKVLCTTLLLHHALKVG